jgi:hypothetical protein
MIRKVKGGKFVVVSHSGKRLSKPTSHAKAVKRLQQVEYFKHRGK